MPVEVDEPRAHVRRFTLVRPERRNALVNESWVAIERALHDALDAEGVRCLVVVGADGFFSAGGDLKVPPTRGAGAHQKAGRVALAHRVLSALRAAPLPTIAAVEGGAHGAGWSLALACDLVVSADDAVFSAPFVQRGVVPDGAATWHLVECLGHHRAASILLAGALLTASEAAAAGLVHSVTQPGAALGTALDLAEQLVACDRNAIELTKRLLVAAPSADLETFLALELASASLAQHLRTADAPPQAGA